MFMSEEKCKYVFVVLTYRNTEDVKELFESLKERAEDYKVIVVNSYYDEETKISVKETAEKNGAVFINVENKGYGYGNNRGIEYALAHYDFDWLVIANPDTVVKKFDLASVNSSRPMVIAPSIVNLNGKKQNPMRKKISMLSNRLQYKAFKKNSKFLLYCGLLIAKIKNVFAVCKRDAENKKLKKISVAHGSFVIYSRKTFEIIGLPYDEKIFLFGEEGVLAKRAADNGIPTFYYDGVQVLHKEDGSMKFRSDINEHLAKANIYVYENYYSIKK